MKHNPAGAIIIGLALATIGATQTAAASPDRWEDSLTLIIRDCRTQQLPLEPIENKINEGRAKNRSAAEIYTVVKVRQHRLLELRDHTQGTFSPGYTKQLFDLERSNDPVTKTAEKSTNPSLRYSASPPVTAPVKAASAKTSEPVAPPQENYTATPPVTVKNNGDAPKADRQMNKVTRKAEKTIEKTTLRAEKRMKVIEKQLQKRAIKRQGAGK